MKLAGRVALVTGAQQGIGAAIAVALAGEGADVALTWLDDQAVAEAVAGRVREAGRRAHLIRTDVAKLPEIESASVDFDRSAAVISVRIDRVLKVALLRKTLRRAEKLANIGASYDLRDIAYRLGK